MGADTVRNIINPLFELLVNILSYEYIIYLSKVE